MERGTLRWSAPYPSHSPWLGMQAERTKREKARKAATNTGKPLWDEDGERRGILDKYDGEEEDASMSFGATGQLEAKLSKADETRKRLAAGTASLCFLPVSVFGPVYETMQF